MSSNKVLLIEKPRKRRRDPSISSISAVAAANNNSSLMVTGGRYGIIKNNCVRQKSRFGKLSRQRQVTDQIDSDSRQVNSKSIEQEATTIAPVENRLQATTSAREPASSNRAMLDCSSSRLNALITTTATTVTVTIASLSRRKSCESIQAQAAGKEQQQHIDHYSEKQIILSNAKMPTAARQRSSDSSGGGSSPYSRRHLRTARKTFDVNNNSNRLMLSTIGLLATTLLLAVVFGHTLTAAAGGASSQSSQSDYQQQQQPIEQQQLSSSDYGQIANELPQPPVAQQQIQSAAAGYQSSPSKSSKKIQIVYIKVPLAKLRPNLSHNANISTVNGSFYGQDNSVAASSASNYTAAATSSNYTTQQRDNTETKSHGSQQQQLQNEFGDALDSGNGDGVDLSGNKQQQQQSFLIPMALVQTTQADEQPQVTASGADQRQKGHQQPSGGNSELHAAHAQPSETLDWPHNELGAGNFPADDGLVPFGAFRPQHHNQQQHRHQREQQPMLSPMHNYQRLLSALQQQRAPHHLQQSSPYRQQVLSASASSASSSASASPPSFAINHGFMSSFLQAEKDKMHAAALARIQPLVAAASHLPASSPSPVIASSSSSSSSLLPIESNANVAHVQPNNNNQFNQQPLINDATATNNNGNRLLAAGGLMPAAALVPFSRMPDNAIGQAYNAAVGRALAAESGSPAQSMLMSGSSTSTDTSNSNQQVKPQASSYGQQQQQQTTPTQAQTQSAQSSNGNYNGGMSGANGQDGSSHGISSGNSFGTNGQGHSESISSGSAYQSSSSGSGASGGSSNYGSGTNTFGVSAAFTDYPAASGANNQQVYAQGQQKPQVPAGNNNNNNYNQQTSSTSDPSQLDYANANRLRQAKKTIIPIVVQVEHSIMENAQQQYNNINNNNLNTNQQVTRGNKYSGGRSKHGKRGRHGKQAGQQQQNGYGAKGANQNLNQNGLFGAATNDVNVAAHFSGADAFAQPSGSAQYINAANAHDINQITAAINAENAASAAAALAAADAAFGPSMPAYIGAAAGLGAGASSHNVPVRHNSQPQQQHRPQQSAGTGNSYSSGALQSAASALLANTHPMIQAAASGGLASVSKLGAKLGEIMALPSIQMPAISSIGQSLPSAFSTLSNQMVAQVAKDHPMASAFARQVAQHAGIQLPSALAQAGSGSGSGSSANSIGHHNTGNSLHSALSQFGGPHQMMSAAASQQSVQSVQSPPQSQLANIAGKLGIGQSLQTAASQLLGGIKGTGNSNNVNSNEAQSSAAANALSTLLTNNQLALQSVNNAFRQIGLGPMQQAALAAMFPGSVLTGTGAGSGEGSGNMAALLSSAGAFGQNPFSAGGSGALMQANGASGLQFAASDLHNSAAVAVAPQESGKQTTSSSSSSGSGKSKLKSKFLSFFTPPKFISNLLTSWNDRADEREDKGTVSELTARNATGSGASTTSAATMTTLAITPSATTATSAAPTMTASSPKATSTLTPMTTTVSSATTMSATATTTAKANATATETPATATSSKPVMSTTATSSTKKN